MSEIPMVQANSLERQNPGRLLPMNLIVLDDKKDNFLASKLDYVSHGFVQVQGVFVTKNFDTSKAQDAVQNKSQIIEISIPINKITYIRNLSFKAK